MISPAWDIFNPQYKELIALEFSNKYSKYKDFNLILYDISQWLIKYESKDIRIIIKSSLQYCNKLQILVISFISDKKRIPKYLPNYDGVTLFQKTVEMVRQFPKSGFFYDESLPDNLFHNLKPYLDKYAYYNDNSLDFIMNAQKDIAF